MLWFYNQVRGKIKRGMVEYGRNKYSKRETGGLHCIHRFPKKISILGSFKDIFLPETENIVMFSQLL